MGDAEQRLAAAGLPVHRGEGVLDFPYGHALGYVFFAGLNQSPTDRPEHFAHANTAFRLEGVWLEGQALVAVGRRIAGLTVSVRSLTIVRQRLGRERIECRQTRGGNWSSLVVNGSMAHGVRLEFREYARVGRP
jgi:hypothetical protein